MRMKSIYTPKILSACCVVMLALLLVKQFAPALAQPSPASLTVREIMAEPSIAGMRAEGEKLAPDGEQAAYLWSATGREPRDLYIVSTRGGEKPRLMARAVDDPQELQRPRATEETVDEARAGDERKEERVMLRDSAEQAREQSVSAIEWSPDSRRLLFSKNGDLYLLNTNNSPAVPRRLTNTVAKETAAQWLADSRRILYQSGEDLFVIDADQTSITQLTRDGGNAAAEKRGDGDGHSQQSSSSSSGGAQKTGTESVSAAQASHDGARVAYIVSDTSRQRALVVPNYAGEFVTAPVVRRGWTEQRLQIVNSTGSSAHAVVIKLPEASGASYIRGFKWTPDSRSLLIDRIDRDTKRRQLFLASAINGEVWLVDEESDAKWVAALSRIVEPSPGTLKILFASERHGFNHLYLTQPVANRTTPTGRAPSVLRQLTRGSWEVNWARWLADGERILYSSTEASTAERHFYVLDTRDGKAQRLPTASGMNTDPQLSKTGSVLLYKHSEWNVPTDLYSLRVGENGREPQAPARLTDTVPTRFKQVAWARPQLIEYRAGDGKSVKARIYTPPGFDKAGKHPAVVFVHGAGYLQNVINGWNNYWREAMFHTLLTARGYVVLDLDYRGSAGYGRDWRTDVHGFLGGLDLQDHLDGIDYIVKNYAVDPARVGMYGGSYGGFMAEMAAMRAPERIACAAALRAVADWKNYYAASPVYTTERLGFPDKNPEAYRRSSPVTYADQLRRPLLILHGMVDDNVHFQDSAQLAQKLIELGKSEYFDVMFYPVENHAFIRPESWTDEYERILRFFDMHLRKAVNRKS
jgi:dipeptidyl aminopeptidase/acylaminoacyl peptidase